MNQSSTINNLADQKQFGWWGNLLLSRKLLLAFGALFFLTILVAAVTLSGLNITTATYEEVLSSDAEVRIISDQLTINLLSARRDSKDYQLNWRTQGPDVAYANYATLFAKDIVDMRSEFEKLPEFGADVATVSTGNYSQAQYDADLAALGQDMAAYEQGFLAYAAQTKARGADENMGLEGEMRTAARSIELKVSGVSGLEPMEITYLQMRRHEKDYIQRNDQVYIGQLHTAVAQLRSQITATDQLSSAVKTELRGQADIYLNKFDAIVEADKQLAAKDAELANIALTLQTSILKIRGIAVQLLADDTLVARENGQRTLTFSLTTVFIALVISIMLAIALSRQITRPVTQLTNTARQIAEGNFAAQAEVSSMDEVGTLAQTFNTMTSRLEQAFETVRRRALAVQTSAEVSQRLSMATNPRQLAVEVVEQVQAAFHYYHAHIYFLDETSGDLIMAGGTGEAGAKMLASGHKVLKGRGLVGRAAATNAPVLVPDVTQAEGWLPNALLPDTKSEVAIPISAGKQVLGVLDVQQNTINGLDEEDVALLQSLAGQVAISLQNARVFEESRAKAELESLVNSIGQKIQRATSVDDTLQIAIREVGLALGATRVFASIGLQSAPARHGIEEQ